jgi:hypothetical protein
MSLLMRLAVGAGVLILVAGCGLVPEIAHQPMYHNPFPQLTKVAVAPFFNVSTEPTVDGRQFANAYFNELQSIPGFEVVPVGIVEEKAHELNLSLANPVEVRKLAQALDVDAIVVGAVTDFSPYYPPRCALQIEWYTANPCFHPIPIGYGLPWGTTEEEFIPDTLVLETEMGLARKQLETQTPDFSADELIPVHNGGRAKAGNLMAALSGRDRKKAAADSSADSMSNRTAERKQYPGRQISYHEPTLAPGAADGTIVLQHGTLPSVLSAKSKAALYELPDETPTPHERSTDTPQEDVAVDSAVAEPAHGAPRQLPPGPAMARVPKPIDSVAAASLTTPLPSDWPDPRGLVPPSPECDKAECRPTYEPVLRHTRAYNGNDVHFTTALESYLFFRDEARIGGWQSYLQRSDDFIRFCCHLHITEMLTARGGAGETRVVWRWPERR